mgnify:CR=1 FL=1
MSGLIDISKPTRSSIPRPTREQLCEVIQILWRLSQEFIHDLEKGTHVDKFSGACISVGTSNLKAMVELLPAYLAESGNVLRNLVETTVDFFWVESVLEKDKIIGERLVRNFFLFADYKNIQMGPTFLSIIENDHFFRDIKDLFTEKQTLDKSRLRVGSIKFGKTWRHENGFLPGKDVQWKKRCELAADFVQRHMNLKSAPYLKNLENLSSFSHFDPLQIIMMHPKVFERTFDRNLNIGLGFIYDMVMFIHTKRSWKPSNELGGLQHRFLWFPN